MPKITDDQGVEYRSKMEAAAAWHPDRQYFQHHLTMGGDVLTDITTEIERFNMEYIHG